MIKIEKKTFFYFLGLFENQVDNFDADDDMNADDLEAAENAPPIKPLEPRTINIDEFDMTNNAITTQGTLNDEDARCYSARY